MKMIHKEVAYNLLRLLETPGLGVVKTNSIIRELRDAGAKTTCVNHWLLKYTHPADLS